MEAEDLSTLASEITSGSLQAPLQAGGACCGLPLKALSNCPNLHQGEGRGQGWMLRLGENRA